MTLMPSEFSEKQKRIGGDWPGRKKAAYGLKWLSCSRALWDIFNYCQISVDGFRRLTYNERRFELSHAAMVASSFRFIIWLRLNERGSKSNCQQVCDWKGCSHVARSSSRRLFSFLKCDQYSHTPTHCFLLLFLASTHYRLIKSWARPFNSDQVRGRSQMQFARWLLCCSVVYEAARGNVVLVFLFLLKNMVSLWADQITSLD